MRSHAKAAVAVLAMLLLTLALAANPASAEAPTVAIDPPTEVAYTTAKVSGTVDPKDIGTWWSFETSADGGASWSGFGYHGFAEENTGPQATPFELTGLAPDTDYELRLVANNSTDPEVISGLESFTTLPVAKPSVSHDPVSNIAGESASFAGTVNPNAPDSNENLSDAAKAAFETTYRFECTPGCPNNPGSQTIAADDEAQSVSFDATGLEPSTQYEVTLHASNAGGEESQSQTFTTQGLAPTAITHLVANLLSDSARLTGFVDPQNEPTSYFFEWGKAADLSDAKSLPASENGDAGSGGQQIAVGEDLTNLAPNSTYYYRLVTDSPTGPPSVGEIESFTTRETPPPMGGGVGAFGDRVIELVNEPDTSGNPIEGARLSEDGNSAVYFPKGGSPHSEAGVYAGLMAQRTSDGWIQQSLQPPPSAVPYETMKPFWTTPDLSKILFVGEPSWGDPGERRYFTYSPLTGDLDFGGRSTTAGVGFVGSVDLGHFFRQGDGSLDPADPSTIGGLYDYSTDPPQLVGFLPGEVAPSCGVKQENGGDFPFHSPPRSRHWSSDDGTRLYFHSRGSGDCEGNPRQLYMREAGPSGSLATGTGAKTTLVSGPVLSGSDLGATPGFLSATSDGSVVFFASASVLDADDTNEGNDIYRHTVGVGNECITCFAPRVEPTSNILVSEDGSRVYFNSARALAPGALDDGLAYASNLYVWRAESPDEVEFIAPGGFPRFATPDGSTLIFEFVSNNFTAAKAAALDRLTSNDNTACDGFCEPVYRYDEAERSLTCASCEPAGAGPRINLLYEEFAFASAANTGLSADGEMFVFVSSRALVAGDVNAELDVYEWRLGKVGLITDGVRFEGFGSVPGARITSGISPDGRDVLFLSPLPLAPGAIDTSGKLYDARIGGGFPPEPVPPVPCAGDSCRSAPTEAPPSDGAGSAQFAGPPNQSGERRCGKGKVRKRGKCAKKPKKQKAKKHSSKKASANRGGGK